MLYDGRSRFVSSFSVQAPPLDPAQPASTEPAPGNGGTAPAPAGLADPLAYEALQAELEAVTDERDRRVDETRRLRGELREQRGQVRQPAGEALTAETISEIVSQSVARTIGTLRPTEEPAGIPGLEVDSDGTVTLNGMAVTDPNLAKAMAQVASKSRRDGDTLAETVRAMQERLDRYDQAEADREAQASQIQEGALRDRVLTYWEGEARAAFDRHPDYSGLDTEDRAEVQEKFETALSRFVKRLEDGQGLGALTPAVFQYICGEAFKPASKLATRFRGAAGVGAQEAARQEAAATQTLPKVGATPVATPTGGVNPYDSNLTREQARAASDQVTADILKTLGITTEAQEPATPGRPQY